MTQKIELLTSETSWIVSRLSDLTKRLKDSRLDVSMSTDINKCVDDSILILVGYDKVIPKSQLQRFKSVTLVHESDLPKDRGWAPMSWQILRGSSEIVVSLILASEKVDTGKILDQTTIYLSGSELHNEWRKLQFEATEKLIRRYLNDPEDLEISARDQPSLFSYNRRRTVLDSQLDPAKTIASQFNLLRIVDNENYPAFFYIDGQRFDLAIYRRPSADKEEK
jgi:methionyl-tRNA formyltransferase